MQRRNKKTSKKAKLQARRSNASRKGGKYTSDLTRLGVPDRVRTTLTYADIIAISPGSHVGQYTFRGNSVYDPDYTSTGHQPYYRDQLAALYSRYRVYSSSIKVSIVNEQVATALQVTVIPASDITAFTSSTYPLEYPYAKGARLLGVGAIFTSTVKHEMSTQEILGLRAREVLDQDYAALVGAQPSSEWYWQIVAQDLSAQNVATSLQVVLKYDVEFYDRVSITPSFVSSVSPPSSFHSDDPLSRVQPRITGKGGGGNLVPGVVRTRAPAT